MKRGIKRMIGLVLFLTILAGSICWEQKESGVGKGTYERKEVVMAATKKTARPSKNGALKVKGTQLVDKNGKAVVLRGISTHGLAWFPKYVNQKCFQDFSKWGANVIRLAMYTSEYGGYCNGGDTEALERLIEKGVAYAEKADMYVIIDWHILSDGNPRTNQGEAKKFFKKMSKKYAKKKHVIYEICNEPNGDTSWEDIKAYANDIIPVIRKNDKKAVIIVGTPNWSQFVDQAAGSPLEGYKNIMYALHFYAATHKEWLRDNLKAAIKQGLPIFVTEYGICDASGDGELDYESAEEWQKLLDKYKISSVAWNLSNKNESSSLILPSVTKKNGFKKSDLTESGKWVYKLLKNN